MRKLDCSKEVKAKVCNYVTYHFNPHIDDMVNATFQNNIERDEEEIRTWDFIMFKSSSISFAIEEIETNDDLEPPRSTAVGDVISCTKDGITEYFMVATIGFKKLKV